MPDRIPPSPLRATRVRFSLGSLTATAALVLGLAACADTTTTAAKAPADAPALASSDARGYLDDATVHYGQPVRVGNGLARTYVVVAKGTGQDRAPLEIGVALDERSMEGLPAPTAMKMNGPTHGGVMSHGSMTQYLLPLPEHNATPFQLVELDWNAAGHEPPGIYDIPHFDFHFYTITLAQRNAIDPARAEYAAEAGRLPAAQYRFPFYVDASTAAGGAPPAAVAVPFMGIHWLDVRSPELQGALGNPAGYRPFTRTFIYGSWDGQVTFAEPMITRAYIMSKRDATDPAVRDEVTPVSVAGDYEKSGYYPSAYRIAWDATRKEYRIALTQLAWRE